MQEHHRPLYLPTVHLPSHSNQKGNSHGKKDKEGKIEISKYKREEHARDAKKTNALEEAEMAKNIRNTAEEADTDRSSLPRFDRAPVVGHPCCLKMSPLRAVTLTGIMIQGKQFHIVYSCKNPHLVNFVLYHLPRFFFPL